MFSNILSWKPLWQLGGIWNVKLITTSRPVRYLLSNGFEFLFLAVHGVSTARGSAAQFLSLFCKLAAQGDWLFNGIRGRKVIQKICLCKIIIQRSGQNERVDGHHLEYICWHECLCTHMKSYEMPSCGFSKEMDEEINRSNSCSCPSARSTAEAGYHDILAKHSVSHTLVQWLGGCRRRQGMICWVYPALRGWSMSLCTQKNPWWIMWFRLLVLGFMSFESLSYCVELVRGEVQESSSLMNGNAEHGNRH